jgi:hypothetical protein
MDLTAPLGIGVVYELFGEIGTCWSLCFWTGSG